jgi:site-specific DNA-methyltransferase (adenine-specific)
MHSSASDEWATPQAFVDALERRLGVKFTLDPCATAETAKAPAYYTKEDNGLVMSWGDEVVFCNPPYSDVANWVGLAAFRHNFTACLVPARTDTKWFHAAVENGGWPIFLKGRLKFGDQKNSAPFPSCVIVFGMNEGERDASFNDWRTW